MDVLTVVSDVCSIVGVLVSLFVVHKIIRINKIVEKSRRVKKVKQIAIGGKINQKAGDTHDSTSWYRR